MKTIFYLGLVFLVMAFCCCDESDECDGRRFKITLGGEIIYDDYESGPIRIAVYEEESERCGENGHVTTQSPGEMIGETELEEPGPFEIEVIVEWIGYEKPGIYVLAFNDSEEGEECKAGGMDTVAAKVQDDIEIELVTDDCPALQ